MINRRTAINASMAAAAFSALGGLVVAGAAAPSDEAPRFTSAGSITRIIGLTEEGPVLGYRKDILIPTLGGREPMNRANAPERLHPSLTGELLRLGGGPKSGESSRAIFPASWWPMETNGIAFRYNSRQQDYNDWTTDPDNLSPIEKYDRLFYPGQSQRVPEVRNYTLEEGRRRPNARGAPHIHPAKTVIGPATAWELQNHGLYQRNYPEEWWGHCNGWSSYVTAEKDAAPRRDVRVRVNGQSLVECSGRDNGCVLFRAADIEALLTEVYFHDASTVAGQRCDVEASAMGYDMNSRPLDPVCRDLNPATLHIALTGLLGRGASQLATPNAPAEHLPFVVDYAFHNEVWTFPVVKYQIDEMEPVNDRQATQLVCSSRRCNGYQWNENARRFARVKSRYWVVAYAASVEELLMPPLQRSQKLAETVLNYVLELDGRGTILGGEWIEPPTTNDQDNKQMHPDFAFMSVRPNASDEGSDDRGGSGDNPHLSYPNIQAILRIAQARGN